RRPAASTLFPYTTLFRSGSLLNRLFHDALHAGKKARAQTTIAESPASVPSAGAALAQQVFGELAGRRVVIVGAGKVGELAARGLDRKSTRLNSSHSQISY